VLAAEPGAVAVYPAFALLDAVGTVTETVVPEELDLTEILRLQHAPAGPGAMFRREPALIAARFAAPERNGRLAFWLKLAAAGKLRRVAAALASAPARPSPPPGGIEAARARLEALQRAVAELPLPADSEQLVAAAARSACVLAAAEIEGFNDAADRICTVDRLELLAPPADPDADAELAILEAEVVDLERDLARRQTAVSVLESAVEGRRGG
jgi:hypothetical protein